MNVNQDVVDRASLTSTRIKTRFTAPAPQHSTASILRANAVLISLSICAATIPSLALAWTVPYMGLGACDDAQYAYQFSDLFLAFSLYCLLRLLAGQAYKKARHLGQLQRHPTRRTVNIHDDCPRAWLVQLHVDLHIPRHLADDLPS